MLHKQITKWIKDYANKNKIEALVVGVSGGIDSAVVSTLCANTKLPTHVLTLPIRQNKKLHALSERQATFLQANWANVQSVNIDLTKAFTAFEKSLSDRGFKSQLAFANSRSRLRMMALYQVAQSVNGIVVGTGNKVEDFGVGFFTKYGDGGVDISPIADLLKSEVWELGRQLGVPEEIISATPTDGLWDDARTDEDQLAMSYPELEHCMMLDEMKLIPGDKTIAKQLKHYRKLRAKNYHKMTAIPIFKKSN